MHIHYIKVNNLINKLSTNDFRWKALDFASLNNSSVSFFKVEKQETAVSKWARAKKRAAKVIHQKTMMETASSFAFSLLYICT